MYRIIRKELLHFICINPLCAFLLHIFLLNKQIIQQTSTYHSYLSALYAFFYFYKFLITKQIIQQTGTYQKTVIHIKSCLLSKLNTWWICNLWHAIRLRCWSTGGAIIYRITLYTPKTLAGEHGWTWFWHWTSNPNEQDVCTCTLMILGHLQEHQDRFIL